MKSTHARRLAAAALALLVGPVVWFEIIYLSFGLTGDDPPVWLNAGAAVLAFGGAFAVALRGGSRPAAVVQRGCRAGFVAVLLLPAVAFAVLLLWEALPGRRDLGMGGMMLYVLPWVALGAAVVLGLLFLLGNALAARRLRAGAQPPQK